MRQNKLQSRSRAAMTHPLRDAACVVGIGRSAYGKRGELAEEGTLRLALTAIHDDWNQVIGFTKLTHEIDHKASLQ